jgi:KEOPS complex subunit Cgi121
MKVYQLKCRKTVGLEALEKYKDVQLLDPSNIASQDHIEFAISQAKKAFERGDNLSNNFLVEIVVRASGQRQIKKAFEMMGLKGSKEVIAISENLPADFLEEYQCKPCEILYMNKEKYERLKKAFEISEKEINAVSGEKFEEKVKALIEIIKERIALIPTL